MKICKCKGSLRTVLIENAQYYKCPRCGGFIERPKPQKDERGDEVCP